MLSFQVVKDGRAIQICCDHEGMAILLETLASLVRDPDHAHLRGKSAGGNELSETSPFGEPALQEVTIDFSPDYGSQNSN
jgi:hypothetical protein